MDRMLEHLKESWTMMEATDEMEQWFDKRTAMHIGLVQKYAKKIEDAFPEFKGLVEKAKVHDASKLKDPEKTPYVHITWKYKMKADGKDYEIPAGMNADEVTHAHVMGNSHHPEFHSNDEIAINKVDRDKPVAGKCIDATKMPAMDIAEMCADWCAVSDEKGTKPQDWAKNNINKRWTFTPEQEQLIYTILNKVF